MRAAKRFAAAVSDHAPITGVSARAYSIPTSSPEADGTITWDRTTLVVAHVGAGGLESVGYSYASSAAAVVINETLQPLLLSQNCFDIPRCWLAMCSSVRNMGRSGIAACAISAVDNALWDLKAKLLGLPLVHLLGKTHDAVPVYGSGGFTTYSPDRIREQIGEWQKQGIRYYKIKIGLEDLDDESRIKAARAALPESGQLFVDANGAYDARTAVEMANRLKAYEVAWFEEPVSSDDIPGLRFVRDHAPAAMTIAAGEYSYNADDCRRLLEAQAVDVIQVDATRCLGITGFLQAAALADAFHLPLSSHCAPALHSAVMCHTARAVHMEYFYDHARIERLLFEGVDDVRDGNISAQTERPGFGFVFKQKEAEKYLS